jgi:peptidyl-tRNA hydrolase, PTH1 family
MKFLIAGLGNIGTEYENTRHNIGFQVVEKMAASAGGSFVSDRYASVCEVRHKGKTFVLIRPTTYMNLSGNAVRYWLQHENIPNERMLVVTDDLALPFGKVRIRARFGIGSTFSKGHQVDYVLGKWSEEEQKTLEERQAFCVDACFSFGTIGVERTMNFFNQK